MTAESTKPTGHGGRIVGFAYSFLVLIITAVRYSRGTGYNGCVWVL